VVGREARGLDSESAAATVHRQPTKSGLGHGSRDLATAAVANYIETFYNRSRRHSHLGGVSPEQFEIAHKTRKRGVH
jgi:putative transposase